MTWPLSPPQSAGVVTAVVIAAFLGAPPASHAQSGLLGLEPTTPIIQFDLTGTIAYDGAELVVDAEPFAFLGIVPSPVLPATGGPQPGTRDFVIRIGVDSAGNLVGGNASGPDLVVIGNVPGAGADGLLLTGEVRPNGAANCLPVPTGGCRGFGFAIIPSGAEFEIRFEVTGGALKDMYAHDVVVQVSSVNQPSLPPITGFAAPFDNPSAAGTAAQIALPIGGLPTPPVLTLTDATAEATGPTTPVTFNASASDTNGTVPVTCTPSSGSLFPLGTTEVSCSASNAGGTTTASLHVTVQDTTPPVILGGSRVEVEATAPGGAIVVLPWTAKDLASGDELLPVTCDNVPPGSFFPVGTTYLVCHASDGRGNQATETFEVTVTIQPPTFPGGNCFIVDFREITYFRKQVVLTSSDAAIRAAAGLPDRFEPEKWPYLAGTKSKGTLFRLYGFQPSEAGQQIPSADSSLTSYTVQYDAEAQGYYIDLGGPARVFICPQQLHDYVLAGRKGNGHVDSSTLLPKSQRNVPGVMLTRNAQILKLPRRIKREMTALGLDHGGRGLIDYVGVQLQGNGSAEFREFVSLEISFPGDSETDRLQHFKNGLHTVINMNFETFAGCDYLDHAPGNDGVRLRDIWGPNRSRKQGYENWRPCGTREPVANKKVRANYELPFNAVQVLTTVNTGVDTVGIHYGEIRPVVANARQRLEHKSDWREWEAVDY